MTDIPHPLIEQLDGVQSAACQSAIYLKDNRLPVKVYRKGMEIDWKKVIDRKAKRSGESKRGVVRDMSQRSMNRLVFYLNETATPFGVMHTCTFRENVMDGRPAMKRYWAFLRGMGLGDVASAWVREYQERGAVHYHVLFEREPLEKAGWLDEAYMEVLPRKPKRKKVLRGPLEEMLVSAWILAAQDCSREFQSFQWGGTVEPLEDADSAARYFGSYLGKEEQKRLPEGAELTGRWWGASHRCKPVPEVLGWLLAYDREVPFRQLHDGKSLRAAVTTNEPPIYIPKW